MNNNAIADRKTINYLPGTRNMNNIGFGCSRLTSNLTKKQAIHNLETAYDNGITHFDVARLYGYGLAEGILGKFAQNKRSNITITTKVGLFPNKTILKNLFVQNTVRYFYRLAKKSGRYKSMQRMAGETMIKKLSLCDVQNSLETSLTELRTDYIDYYLLHEANIAEANREELIYFLEIQKDKGRIKAYGIASYADKIVNDFPRLIRNYSVLQTNNSFPVGVPEVLLNATHIKKRFYFSPYQNLGKVKSLFESDIEFTRQASNLIGYDLRTSYLDLFLLQQFYSGSEATFLFTSNKTKRIKTTIQRWAYLESVSSDSLNQFAKVRSMVNQKLFQTPG